MNRPHPFKYLIGNLLVLLLAGGMAAAAAWVAYVENDSQSWIAVALFGALTLAAGKARGEVKSYRDWEVRWNSYGAASGAMRGGGFTIKLAIAVVGGFAAIIWEMQAGQSEHGRSILSLLGLGFGSLAAIGVAWRISAAVGKARERRAQTAPMNDPVVGLCINPPPADPQTLQKAYNSLPEHCYSVLRP